MPQDWYHSFLAWLAARHTPAQMAPPALVPRPRFLRLEALEDRLTPATFAEDVGLLELDLNTVGEAVGIVSSGTAYTLTLTGGTWSGTNSANVTGSGTNILTVTPAGVAAFTDVAVSDSAAGTAVAFNAGTGPYFANVRIALVNSVTAAVVFNGSLTLSGPGTRVSITSGSVTSPGASAADVAAEHLDVSVTSGIGTPTDPLTTRVSALEAMTATGGIFVANSVTALQIGGATSALSGVTVVDSGAIAISNDGSIGINVGGDVVAGPGAITITAAGPTTDVLTGGFNAATTTSSDAVVSSGGPVSIIAGRDVLIGDAAGGGYGDVAGVGVTLSAGRHVVVDETSFVQGRGTGGVTVTAGTAGGPGDVSVLATTRSGASISTAGGGVIITTAPDGWVTLDSDGDPGTGPATIDTTRNGATGGGVTVTADHVDLTGNDRIAAGAGVVTIRGVTLGQGVTLGSSADAGLEMSDPELDRIAAGTLRVVGGAAGVAVALPVTRPAATAVELVGAGPITLGPGSIDTAGGTLLLAGTQVRPTAAGTDAAAGGVTVAAGTALAITIGGTTADTQYGRLAVTGPVTLTGTALALSGAYVPSVSDAFTVVSAGSVTGTFAGLPDGSIVMFNGVPLRVRYRAAAVALAPPSAPTAGADTVTVAEDAAATAVNVLANDAGVPDPAEPLTVTAVTQPAHGTVTLAGGVVRYAPAADYHGSDAFTYTVSDQDGETASGTVSVTVTPVNDPPVANPDATVVAANSSAMTIPVLANDTSAPDSGETLVVTAVTQPASGGTATVAPGGAGVVFTPAPGFAGTAMFTYTVGDGTPGSTATASVTVTVASGVGPVRPVAVGGAADGSVQLVTAGGTVKSVAPFGATGTPTRTATGDINGDGVVDIVAVTGPGTALRLAVISGADGSVLVAPFDPFGGNFPGGGYVAGGDLDGDGKAEFAVTPDEGGGPRVTVFSMTAGGGAVVRSNFFGIDDPNFRGGARAALGDVNGDVTPDVVVAAGFGGGPRTAIFTGQSVLAGAPARLVGDFFAFPGSDASNLRNGSFVAAGDVTGDGFADLVFGGGPGGAPRVFILSGALVSAGQVAAAQASPVANFFVAGDLTDRGGARVAVTNADGDAKADVAVGSGAARPANVRVYLGKDFVGGGEPPALELDPFGGAVLADGVYVG